jgi:acyl-coenzyme A thioesterase PaaI-like protein
MSSQFEPKDPHFKSRVSRSFDEQAVMTTIGAALAEVEPGRVVIELPYRPELTQQDVVDAGRGQGADDRIQD